ncbi:MULTISPECIES: phosphoribosyltransferase [unclassified Modestobacter]|uniref:phosphoribosyltransferase n=1 Tax=unclassified Modestobacter TaxID=2643866 RepID=UPI0022AA3D5C|nr:MULTISPECIES: phosphoribosyltransferase family protein [unclassified Modestobacter]MCZ2826360.1 phosphoribosyltransferase family protein [Modestobacter sp. VKM Ac-2981]MCZ2852575.1 phosphoribosyltransferase family protein [Modestobacter sp. VKM Ac-2982]
MSATTEPFADRVEAGRALAARLPGHADPALVVLGLPRGGVVVAGEVARALGGALDVVVVRKIGVPWQPELAMGAIAAVDSDVETVHDQRVLAHVDVDEETFARAREREVVELRRREAAYRQGRPVTPLAGRPVLVVDDGLATGSTMRAALTAVRRQGPSRLTVAVPVASPRVCAQLADEVDEVVCLWAPESFSAVGQGYRDFRPTTDDEVRAALAGSAAG